MVVQQPRQWVVEAADGPCPTCRGTGGHPTLLKVPCPACHGSTLEFKPIWGLSLKPALYPNENAAQITAANWLGGRQVLYRAIQVDPCPDHHGYGCVQCRGLGYVRHQPNNAPIFGDLLPPNERGIL